MIGLFILKNWREYEHAHTLCWCGKDLMWNLDFMPLWVVFFFCTMTIGADFVWVTWKSKVLSIIVVMCKYIFCDFGVILLVILLLSIHLEDDDRLRTLRRTAYLGYRWVSEKTENLYMYPSFVNTLFEK